ncbi:MAG: hypothetical protein KGD57_03240 [Candidatus Lokiarchaeota archaeon]|nr:hypothetical protein [Candidatus Lokiarchaeota archaeon]
MKHSESSSTKRHDLYNFETKIEYKYTLEKKKRKKVSYLLDTFFFIPKSLQINRDTYDKEQFFSDLHNRIRFKTPKMSIKDILDEKNILSPLNIINKNLVQPHISDSIDNLIQRELRILASIIKSTLKDKFQFFLNNCELLNKRKSISKLIEEYLINIEEFKNKLVEFKNKILKIQTSEELRDTFQYSDEYISLQLEMWLTKILSRLKKYLDTNTKNSIIKSIENEQSYRRNLNSRLVLEEGTDNEGFIFLEGIMKKYVQGVLYLEKKIKAPQASSLEIFYSIGAGLAMFISLFLGFFIYSNLEEYSIPFIAGAVVIYMLRDRIKDNIRGISQKAVTLYLPDKKIDIMDGFFEEKIGISKEKMYFTDFEKIPLEIIQIRKSSNKSLIENEGKPEVCIIFKKKMILLNKKINKLHTRHTDILDVTRFNIHNFLRYADDPIQKVISWKENENKLDTYSISKVYHLNIIFKLISFQGKKIKEISYQKYRIILNQKGIKKVLAVQID